MLRELFFYSRKYKIILVLLFVQITVFFIILGSLLTFIYELDYENDRIAQIYNGKEIYQIIDNYYDGAEYARFTSQSDALNRLKQFYRMLNTANEFQYLAMFDHYILIESSEAPDKAGILRELADNSNNGGIAGFVPVNSFQMNLKAFEFFELELSTGEKWTKEDFENGELLPVILGDAYKEGYNIGDRFRIQYYFKEFECVVTGFFKHNSKVFFKGDSEFSLDRMVILPYVDYLAEPVSAEEAQFQVINYFAMVNGFIVQEQDIPFSYLKNSIDYFAEASGFGGYTFINYNPHFSHYESLMSTVENNGILVKSVLGLATVLNVIIICLIIMLIQNSRRRDLSIHFINGRSRFRLIARQWIETFLIIFFAFILSTYFLLVVFRILSLKSMLLLFVTGVSISVLTSIVEVCRFNVKSLVHSIQK